MQWARAFRLLLAAGQILVLLDAEFGGRHRLKTRNKGRFQICALSGNSETFRVNFAESPEIGKGGWPGTAELAAAQPTVHVNLNVTTPRVAYKSPLSLYRL